MKYETFEPEGFEPFLNQRAKMLGLKNYTDLFELTESGFFKLKNFTYTEPNFKQNKQKSVRYFVATNENDIVAIVKYSTELLPLDTPNGVDSNIAGCMFYLEINENYRNQGLLHVICDNFAKNFQGKAFCSNSESKSGRVTHVNLHLRVAFLLHGVDFYQDTNLLLHQVNNAIVVTR